MKMQILFLLLIVSLILTSCNCSFWGSKDLGNNLTLFEGDKTEDRIIIYCTSKSAGCCKGGLFVIPTAASNHDMYIEEAKSNEKWVIAKSIQFEDKQMKYWIIKKGFSIEKLNCDEIKCDSIIQTQVQGPFDLNGFNTKKRELSIDLAF